MANVAVVGSQWGDEGKGKIVDWLSERADIVVRFQGGHNAGHTLVIGDRTYKLSLLPSGVVRPKKIGVIGNGVVVDPWALIKEIETVSSQGVSITPNNLKIADSVPLILHLHQQLDNALEKARGNSKIGTTGRGIGPAYEDKVGRRAIRLCDLNDRETLNSRLEQLLFHHNALLRGLGVKEANPEEILNNLESVASKLLQFSCPVWSWLDEAKKSGKRILFEGAQGAMLDVDHGTYPFVTSSNTVAGQAAAGSGVGPSSIGYILGITKAYTTRVGSGPFPSEQDNEIGELLGQKGHEFGTVTGRKRRCGWFDAVMVRQAVTIGGIDGIALTKVDVLDGLEKIKMCTGYLLNGNRINYLPPSILEQGQVEPIYETFEGWSESTVGARSWMDLPATAIKYVRRIEELIGAPVALLSTSPERQDTILVKDPFSD